jgi:hypothetical protein
LDKLHQEGFEEVTREFEGEGSTAEKAEYDAKRLANSYIHGERVAGKTTFTDSSQDGQRSKSKNEENFAEFDGQFKSVIIISKRPPDEKDEIKTWKVRIRATGVRKINSK